MSLAEELLASIGEEATVHEHPVTDPDNYFVIDQDSREITNVSRTRNTLMQGDHKSEIYTIALPRIVEGHDMTKCNRIRVHFINIGTDAEIENADVAELDPPTIDPKDPSNVIVTWSVRREATQLAGILSFAVQYVCVAADGSIDYEFHSDYYSDVEVKKFRDNGEPSIIKYSNILEDWYQKLFGLEDSLIQSVANVAEAQKEAIARKGEETLATIPEDYTATYNMAEEALRRKANAIELEAEGECIVMHDSSDAYLLGLKLHGKTTQQTTTGAQLAYVNINVNYAYKGVLASATNDGNILVSGTTTEEMWNRLATANLVAGETYTLSSNGALILTVWDATANTSIVTKERNAASITFTAVNTGVHTFVLSNPAYNVFAGIRADIMVNVGSVALPWEPYSAGIAAPCPEYPQSLMSVENPTCVLYGANLFPLREVTAVGVTGIPQTNGTVRYTGKADSNAWHAYQVCPILVDGTYTLSVETVNKTEKGSLIQIYDKNGLVGRSWQNVENRFSCTFDALAGSTVRWNIGVLPDEDVDTTVKLMLNPGSVAYPWEPYAAVQSIAIDRTLHGIHVTVGGNFTDSNGQQWICDEIDFERGTYVQRIGAKVLDGVNVRPYYAAHDNGQSYCAVYPGDNANNSVVMSSHYASIPNNWTNNDRQLYGIGGAIIINDSRFTSGEDAIDYWSVELPTIIYSLATPIETPLTEEEIDYYKKLKTNYHNTTVMNDAGAHMELDYVADTLIYLRDNQPKPTDEQIQTAVNEYVIQNGVQVPSDDHIRSIVDEVLGGIVNDEY